MKPHALLIAILFSIFVMSSSVLASPVFCEGTKKNPCVVQDTKNNIPKVKQLRDMQMILTAYKGNIRGLENAWVSGSAATSHEGWKTIASYIVKLTHGNVKKMINVDLRQESHGFLNGDSINLTSEFNWINRGKSQQQALSDEQIWLSHLAMQNYIANVLTAMQFKSGDFLQGVNVNIETIQSEAEITEKEGFQYVRITVSDHMAPGKQEVDLFVHLVDTLSKDTWMHIHCRGGNGRTTTFMAMYDMLKNANRVSFDDIIKRHASIPPFYNLATTDRKDPALTKHYKARLNFLRSFYQFANARLEGHKGTWSRWLESHPSVAQT